MLGRRIDLLFRDSHGRRLLVELKWGAIKDEHIGQLLSYEGTLISTDHPDLRVMLVGTRVPPNIRRALDHHGISWKEIGPSQIAALLTRSGELEFAARFEQSNSLSEVSARKHARKTGPEHSTEVPSLASAQHGTTPALLAIVDLKWFDQAREEFREGKEEIYFGTSSTQIGPALRLPVQTVYFKTSGRPEIIASAPFVDARTENIPEKRLQGLEHDAGWKYYYGFREIALLQSPIPISALRYFSTGKEIRPDVPGPCVIQDPLKRD